MTKLLWFAAGAVLVWYALTRRSNATQTVSLVQAAKNIIGVEDGQGVGVVHLTGADADISPIQPGSGSTC